MFWGSETESIFPLRPNAEASSWHRFLFNKPNSGFCHRSRSKTQTTVTAPLIPRESLPSDCVTRRRQGPYNRRVLAALLVHNKVHFQLQGSRPPGDHLL